LFASALAGKPVPLELTQGTVGSSDGSTIFVPASLDQDSLDARYLVICQASLQRSGAYRKDVLRKLNRGGSDIARRYLTLEVLMCRGGADAAAVVPRRTARRRRRHRAIGWARRITVAGAIDRETAVPATVVR
jgi:hypothetical protein